MIGPPFQMCVLSSILDALRGIFTASEPPKPVVSNTPKIIHIIVLPQRVKMRYASACATAYSLYHISVGDVLRAAKADPNNPAGREIAGYMQRGELIPPSLSYPLFKERIEAEVRKGAGRVLEDWLPRDVRQMRTWESLVSSAARSGALG
ncbi:hypothetical protein M501DRAFT_325771 [Patellaria atrata CBS 101060]|uniref:Uncharacterized protein n=1 Tax=Patellaria atrata CBS 101060 TaxID=1346257 RepID=A0A9P4VLL2_9PEZI|nr:hypothetical protein M501DRAFT_325771 [Patellaria atrata CBS 101060]